MWRRGYGHIQAIGYVNIVVPGEGLEPEIRNVETWGLGTYIGDVNIGGCRFGDRYGYMGDVHIMGRVGEFCDKHWIC